MIRRGTYRYEDEKPALLTDDGQRLLLRVRDRAKKLLEIAGAVRQSELLRASRGTDTWQDIAIVDRLVELGELEEVTPVDGRGLPTQLRVFIGRGPLA